MMLLPAVIAALAAIPAVVAQDVTSSATRCTTRFGYYPLPTGTAGVPTWYIYTTTTNLFSITSTTRETVVATPSASTLTDVVTTTATFVTTTTSIPAATTVPTPAGFLPLLAVALAGPTAIPRFKRHEIEGRDADTALHLFRRQTAANNTGGFSVDRYGQTSNMYRRYEQRVDCRVSVTVNSTTTTIVTGLPETVFVAGSTATAFSTSTISNTVTVTEILPRSTVYAACQPNNVVNSVTGFTGNSLVFDRVVYRPAAGFPIENELIVNTTSAENCCIACQNTAYCAGSFFAPSDQECHLRLTQKPSLPPTLPAPSAIPSGMPAPYGYGNASNATYPTAYASSSVLKPTGNIATGVMATSLPTVPTTTGTPGTCTAGSLSLYLGTIQGQEDFPIEYALSFSNGPCGRLSVWPIPIREDLDDSLEERKRRSFD